MVKFQPFNNSEFLQTSNLDRKEFVYNRMRDTPNKIKHLDIKLSKMFFDNLEIIAGPKCSDAELEIIQLILEKYGNSIKYEKSKIRIR